MKEGARQLFFFLNFRFGADKGKVNSFSEQPVT